VVHFLFGWERLARMRVSPSNLVPAFCIPKIARLIKPTNN
jgi:hypothetical protein